MLYAAIHFAAINFADEKSSSLFNCTNRPNEADLNTTVSEWAVSQSIMPIKKADAYSPAQIAQMKPIEIQLYRSGLFGNLACR